MLIGERRAEPSLGRVRSASAVLRCGPILVVRDRHLGDVLIVWSNEHSETVLSGPHMVRSPGSKSQTHCRCSGCALTERREDLGLTALGELCFLPATRDRWRRPGTATRQSSRRGRLQTLCVRLN